MEKWQKKNFHFFILTFFDSSWESSGTKNGQLKRAKHQDRAKVPSQSLFEISIFVKNRLNHPEIRKSQPQPDNYAYKRIS